MRIILLASIICLSLTSITHAQTRAKTPVSKAKKGTEKVPFTMARNYFVKNTIKTASLTNPKIESQAAFDKYFGMATLMGDNGKPSAIDFAQNYVIAIIPKPTDRSAMLSLKTLTKKGKTITARYAYKLGEKQSFTSQPFMVLIVNRQYDGVVKLIEDNK